MNNIQVFLCMCLWSTVYCLVVVCWLFDRWWPHPCSYPSEGSSSLISLLFHLLPIYLVSSFSSLSFLSKPILQVEIAAVTQIKQILQKTNLFLDFAANDLVAANDSRSLATKFEVDVVKSWGDWFFAGFLTLDHKRKESFKTPVTLPKLQKSSKKQSKWSKNPQKTNLFFGSCRHAAVFLTRES